MGLNETELGDPEGDEGVIRVRFRMQTDYTCCSWTREAGKVVVEGANGRESVVVVKAKEWSRYKSVT